jgi:hypothetical protein
MCALPPPKVSVFNRSEPKKNEEKELKRSALIEIQV